MFSAEFTNGKIKRELFVYIHQGKLPISGNCGFPVAASICLSSFNQVDRTNNHYITKSGSGSWMSQHSTISRIFKVISIQFCKIFVKLFNFLFQVFRQNSKESLKSIRRKNLLLIIFPFYKAGNGLFVMVAGTCF